MPEKPLLEIKQVKKSFKGLTAVKDISFSVNKGEIVGLIGPNGAGKTSLFNLISGALKPDQGEIFFKKTSLKKLRPDQICHLGIGRTFQLVRPFQQLSVEDNIMVGALARTSCMTKARKKSVEILNYLHLADKQFTLAEHLTLPERKRLEVARALATDPQIILLDEVMAGLRPTETDEMVDLFISLNRDLNLAILMIEHVMRAVMRLSHHVIVLNYGQKIAEGSPKQVTQDSEVLKCYLGEDAA